MYGHMNVRVVLDSIIAVLIAYNTRAMPCLEITPYFYPFYHNGNCT